MTRELKPEARNALRIVATSPSRLTPPALEKTLLKNTRLEKKEIKVLIKDLVERGELTYTYEFGSTFLERSFNKPIRISHAVVIKPPGHQYRPESGDAVLKIKPGAAFGSGRHPPPDWPCGVSSTSCRNSIRIYPGLNIDAPCSISAPAREYWYWRR